MRKSKPLTADALAELGADRLASLLLDAAEHDATVARRLRIAVAARGGADSAAAAIDAEIRRLKRGTAAPSWSTTSECPHLPATCRRWVPRSRDCSRMPIRELALERMFDFIDLAPALIERSDDSDGYIGTHPFGVRGGRLVGGSGFPELPPERAGFRAYQTYSCEGTALPMGSSRLLRKPSMHRHARHSTYGSKSILRACRPRPIGIREPGA